MFALAIVYQYEIYLSHHATKEAAEAALLWDVRDTYAGVADLPDAYDESDISQFIGETGDSYVWKIEEVTIQ